MEMIPLPSEGPLRQRLTELRSSLEERADDIVAFKRKCLERLLAWEENIEGSKLDGVGTFVTHGVRERLAHVVGSEDFDAVQLSRFGWFSLHDGEDEQGLHYASLKVPYHDDWGRQYWINRNFLEDCERITFVPYACHRFVDGRDATLESSGPFLLDDRDEQTARILMTVDYIRGYVGIARTIHTEEERGEYARTRTHLNLQDAFAACEWLEDDLRRIAIEESVTPRLSD